MNQLLLENKVAIITGASRGIGAATARVFAAEGASVALAARNAAALQALANELSVQGCPAIAVPTDVSDPAAVQRLVEQTVRVFGRLDVAFNNAAGGGQPPTRLDDLPVESFDSVIAISLRGVFLSMKSEIPAILNSGGGAIVNMTSTAGLQGLSGLAGYVSAKHGVIGLTRSAALDYAERGLRINAVAPGPIKTESLGGAGEETLRMISRSTPMQRMGSMEEVARAVAWLCSDQASFITGTVLSVDGGWMAGKPAFRMRE